MQKNLWVKIIDWAVIKVIVVFGKLGTMETRDASPHHVHPPTHGTKAYSHTYGLSSDTYLRGFFFFPFILWSISNIK